MKFIFADAIDQIDPGFNFLTDENAVGRKPYWNDQYPHEFFKQAPYDGILVSRGIVGDWQRPGKYSEAHAIRFRREGARSFLRMDTSKYKDMPIYGDCGAFSYVTEKVPPYSPDNMANFYAEGGFNFGCSVDHIIFGFRPEDKGLDGGSPDERERFDITQQNARDFLKASKAIPNFTPMGAVQGWSPESMGIAAQNLEKMGYKYLAIGGMVPLDAKQVHLALKAIRAKLKASTKLHLLGFAKAEQIGEFKDYGIASFDSTSPLLRAFKDATANYYMNRGDGTLDYFTAIRIPQALENPKFTRAVREGRLNQEELAQREFSALNVLRAFDKGKATEAQAAKEVLGYLRLFLSTDYKTPVTLTKALAKSETHLMRTLTAKPWQSCGCEVCRQAGIEVAIFRTSNRNKRRGFHNLQVYFEHLKRITNGS